MCQEAENPSKIFASTIFARSHGHATAYQTSHPTLRTMYMAPYVQHSCCPRSMPSVLPCLRIQKPGVSAGCHPLSACVCRFPPLRPSRSSDSSILQSWFLIMTALWARNSSDACSLPCTCLPTRVCSEGLISFPLIACTASHAFKHSPSFRTRREIEGWSDALY